MKHIKATLVLAIAISQPAWAKRVDIVFLGDDARIGILNQCGTDCTIGNSNVGTPGKSSTASEVASYSQHAKHAVIVVDATQGPLPITREHVQIARQAGVPSLSIMFVNMSGLEGMKDAGELVELEELEVREVMNAYEMGGSAAMVFHDVRIKSIPRLRTSGVGLKEALKQLASVAPRKSNDLKFISGKKLATYVYLLTPQESKYVTPLGEGSSVNLWVNGQVAKGTVVSKQRMMPGANGDLSLDLATSVTAAEGSRFLIERDGKVIAMGVIVRLSS